VHSGQRHLTRPRQNTFIPELHINLSATQEGLYDILEAQDEVPEGGYYLKHPVLDGRL
jgi:hypothetical protein